MEHWVMSKLISVLAKVTWKHESQSQIFNVIQKRAMFF